MASKWKIKAIELVTGLAFTNKAYPSVVQYTPSKTELSRLELKHFNRSTPEKRGVSSAVIRDMLKVLELEPRSNIHSIIVIKDGEVIAECARPGYDVNIRHLSHSMSKTLTGMAIGLLCTEGKLSLQTKLVDIFPEIEPSDRRFRTITIRHLLTMSTGVPFSEVGSVTETEWTKAFFESRLSFAPGIDFAYNSMNSYILARIIVRKTGMSLMNFLRAKVFSPMGIQNVFWELGPEGIEKGGWGAHLSAESWAKLGVMMLGGGVFEGKRILPEEWVRESTSSQIAVPESAGDYNYGYQLWVHRTQDYFLFNGMLGQNVWVCPKNNIVVAVNCENNELFQKSAVLETIEKHLGGDISADKYNARAIEEAGELQKRFFRSRLWAVPSEPKRGITYRIGLRNARPFVSEWNKILGTYTLTGNNTGILPVFIRAMQNNYQGGIESISLEREGEHLYFISREGGIDYRLEVGFYEYKSTVINFNGELYLVRAIGEASLEEDEHAVYKIEIIFPEMPNSRKIKLSFKSDGRLVMKMTETPNEKIAEPLVESIYTTNPKFAFAVKLIEARLGDKFVIRKLASIFSPTLIGVDINADKYFDIVADERKRSAQAEKSTEAVSALIMKLASESKEEE